MDRVHIGIVEPDHFSLRAQRMLARLGAVSRYAGDGLDRFLADKQVLFVRLRHRIDKPFLDAAPRLRVLCSPTTGWNHLDTDELALRDICLLSLRGERAFLDTVRATPEHIVGLTLALLRRYKDAFLGETNGAWDRDRYRGRELYASRVGLVGFGRIGSRLAGYFRAFGAHVSFYDPEPAVAAASGAKREPTLERLIARSDIVIVCAAHTAANTGMIGKRQLDAMAGKYLINAARGELIDEADLLAKLEKGHFAGVALDVIADETGANRLERLLALTRGNNLIVTPHIGGATVESMEKTETFLAGKLAEWLAREPIGGAEDGPGGGQTNKGGA